MAKGHRRRVVPAADRTFKGVVYRSGYEASVARDLAERGLEADYEAETVWYTTPHFSRVDWRIRTASGRTVLVETKGYFPPEDRTKVARIVESNPDLDYRLLFQTGSGGAKIGPAWCRKRGIKFAIGMIPDAWYEE